MTIVACANTHPLQADPEIARTWGWRLHASGAVISPQGTVSMVELPDRPAATRIFIWRVVHPDSRSLYIALYSSPVASGAAEMLLYQANAKDNLTLAARMLHHLELQPHPQSEDDQRVDFADHSNFLLSRIFFPSPEDAEAKALTFGR
jgi:hypothetical protein